MTSLGTSSSQHRITRSAASPASSLIPIGPHAWARPAASARCTWRMVTSGLTGCTRTQPSSGTRSGFPEGMSLPSSVRVGMKGAFQAAAQSASEIEKLEWSRISRERGTPLSAARR